MSEYSDLGAALGALEARGRRVAEATARAFEAAEALSRESAALRASWLAREGPSAVPVLLALGRLHAHLDDVTSELASHRAALDELGLSLP